MENFKSSDTERSIMTDPEEKPSEISAKKAVKLTLREEEDNRYLEEIFDRIKRLQLREKLKCLALCTLYQERKKLECEMEKEIRNIVAQYEIKYMALFEKANEIIEGKRTPSFDELRKKGRYLTAQEKVDKNNFLDASPLKNYWGKVFLNCDLIAHEIKERDVGVFQHLTKVEYLKFENSCDFALRFHFDKNNPFFSNDLLEKRFYMLDEDTPEKSVGTVINWKQDQNLTEKKVKRKQKNKKTGHTKIIERTIEDESFFLFFKNVSKEDFTNDCNLIERDKDEYTRDRMKIDFDIARIIINDVIPFSLEYFLDMVLVDDEYENNNEEESQENEKTVPEKLPKKSQLLKKGKKSVVVDIPNIKNVDDSDILSETSSKISPKESKVLESPTRRKKGSRNTKSVL